MVKVLHIQLSRAIGGIEALLYSIYKVTDRKVIQFDFVTYWPKAGYEDEFKELGSTIYHLPKRERHPLHAKKELENIIREGNYDVVHIHKNSLADISAFKIAKKLKVPKVIIHSHNTSAKRYWIMNLLHKINQYRIANENIKRYACSKKAAEWLFGTKKNQVSIIKNGVDTNLFKYNYEIRCKYRDDYNLKDAFVIGHVGWFIKQKNHDFLIDVFHRVYLRNNNVKLLLVGRGELLEEIKEKVKKLGLENNVIFTGERKDVFAFYQAMDMFVLPSKFEGFGIVAIEAQTSGLPCIVSQEVPNEALVTELIESIELEDMDKWVNRIVELSYLKIRDRELYKDIVEAGYDIKTTAKLLEEVYTE